MQTGIAVFALLFVVACWVFVIGHQLGLSAFDPDRYPVMEAGSLTIAHTTVGLSICAVAGIITVLVYKKLGCSSELRGEFQVKVEHCWNRVVRETL